MISSQMIAESNTLRIGIIGCGRAAELIYLPALMKFPDIEITALVDPVKDRRDHLSNGIKNCLLFSSAEEKLFTQIDAAIISTPPDSHISLASLLLKNEKYVLVEKPLSLSMKGTKELLETEECSNASLMMGFNHRYWQPVLTLKETLPNHGKIHSAEIIFTGNYNSWNPVSFRSDPLNDLGPHIFDLIRFIFNTELLSVLVDSFNESSLNLSVKNKDGIIINCHISHSDETRKIIKVFTNSGNFLVRIGSVRIQPFTGKRRRFLDLNDNITRKLMKKTSPIKLSYEMQLQKFFEMIKFNKKANPGVNDGISAVMAVEAVRQSIIKNKEIFLNEIQ